jgi:hypothetical protein
MLEMSIADGESGRTRNTSSPTGLGSRRRPWADDEAFFMAVKTVNLLLVAFLATKPSDRLASLARG